MHGDVEWDEEKEEEQNRGSKRRQISEWGCKKFVYIFHVQFIGLIE